MRSYKYAGVNRPTIFVWNGKNGDVGHVSIAVPGEGQKDGKEKHMGFWPREALRKESMKGSFKTYNGEYPAAVADLSTEVEVEGRLPDRVIELKPEDRFAARRMGDTIDSETKATQAGKTSWTAGGEHALTWKRGFSCVSMVKEVLSSGGFKIHKGAWTHDFFGLRFGDTMTPSRLADKVVKEGMGDDVPVSKVFKK